MPEVHLGCASLSHLSTIACLLIIYLDIKQKWYCLCRNWWSYQKSFFIQWNVSQILFDQVR